MKDLQTDRKMTQTIFRNFDKYFERMMFINVICETHSALTFCACETKLVILFLLLLVIFAEGRRRA